ncbi:hypothetical protein PsorP6_016291 [Peronosclerospora sorghi]|uniref:Uncharacterized protein n=1 Tax=Peronosclerospora sorghi TaxID=230839 RepID=A0ACC0VLT0_9STRA|nr:hypothetical protein PsorP6_016291 [Peronosclerospora sorghi]
MYMHLGIAKKTKKILEPGNQRVRGYFVLGDLNTSLDLRLYYSSLGLFYTPGRYICLEWLAKRSVFDAWRTHFDTKRVLKGLLPRKNRLDYILLSDVIYERSYNDSRYFLPTNARDRLAHSVSFRTVLPLHGRWYRKFTRYFLGYRMFVSAINKEDEMVRAKLSATTNPGVVTEKWKITIKYQLHKVQKKLRMQDTQAVDGCRSLLGKAAAGIGIPPGYQTANRVRKWGTQKALQEELILLTTPSSASPSLPLGHCSQKPTVSF